MNQLPILDIIIILIYLVAMILVGVYFSRKNRSAKEFTNAGGKIPGWAVGISLYATFLSSNTFLGVPGKAFGGNWNAFVFSLSMPLAAWVGVKYFIPFYRKTGEISAYTHLENRFGLWARTFTVICFLLTQLARMGSVFFGIALALQALTGLPMSGIMIVTGICIIIYTLLGGLEAVVWTEVVQGVVKTLGALLIVYLIINGMPGGVSKIMEIGKQYDKFSLGGLSMDFTTDTFWVILLYGFFINMANFGIDQNYVQRYHASGSEKQAKSSLWLCVYIYVPASLLFFIIGSCLFSYYQVHPELLDGIKLQAARERLPDGASLMRIKELASHLKPKDYGDKVMPFFMVSNIPTGFLGILVSAILSAAMSTISSGMNASATVFTEDIYKRYFKRDITEKHKLRVLYTSTALIGGLAITVGIALIGTQSVLDMWWKLSGIFSAGMLGLFLLGIASRRTGNTAAFLAVSIGVLIIAWLTFSPVFTGELAKWRNPFHTDMTIVIGTLSIFLMGVLFGKKKRVLTRAS